MRCRQPRQLILDGLQVSPVAVQAEPFDEACQALVYLDLWRPLPQGLPVQMRQDQPGLGSVGQAQTDKIIRSGVQGLTGFDQKLYGTVCLFPLPHLVPRIPVGQAGLAQDGVAVEDRAGIVLGGVGASQQAGKAFVLGAAGCLLHGSSFFLISNPLL